MVTETALVKELRSLPSPAAKTQIRQKESTAHAAADAGHPNGKAVYIEETWAPYYLPSPLPADWQVQTLDVVALVGDFVDAGLDILQSLQPRAIGERLAELKRKYGRVLAFQGGIDIQEVLPHGTPAEVAKHVRTRAALLGEGGGYIFGTAHNILPDTPTENVLALIDAYHQYGLY